MYPKRSHGAGSAQRPHNTRCAGAAVGAATNVVIAQLNRLASGVRAHGCADPRTGTHMRAAAATAGAGSRSPSSCCGRVANSQGSACPLGLVVQRGSEIGRGQSRWKQGTHIHTSCALTCGLPSPDSLHKWSNSVRQRQESGVCPRLCDWLAAAF